MAWPGFSPAPPLLFAKAAAGLIFKEEEGEEDDEGATSNELFRGKERRSLGRPCRITLTPAYRSLEPYVGAASVSPHFTQRMQLQSRAANSAAALRWRRRNRRSEENKIAKREDHQLFREARNSHSLPSIPHCSSHCPVSAKHKL